MKNNLNPFQKEQQDKLPQQVGGIDPLVIISLIMNNWYFFVIAVVGAFIGARFYLGHTMRVYKTTITIQINETGDRPLVSNDELLQGLGLPGGMRNLENQIRVLSSRAVTEKALKELPFEIEYYFKTKKNSIPIYPEIPIKVISDEVGTIPKDVEFSILSLGNGNFILKSESEKFVLNKQTSFGDAIEFQGGSFRIECINEEWLKRNKEEKLFFIVYSRNVLINYFNGRLSVELLSQGGSILRVSIEGTNKAKDADFLNKLAEIFHSISLDKKNAEAVRRIQFIDDQLVGITDSLSRTENKLQKFRSTNRVMDVSAQGQAIITQVTLLENERARLNLEANYYDYLADYLAQEVAKQIPIVPITMGISDPGLTRLVTDLAELQGQMLNKGAGEMNPLQGLLTQKIKSTKEALLETLNGLRRANSLAISDNQEQINKVNAQASALPITERLLLGIERKFKLNDQLYTFLLETRANLQMQKASNVADSEVIDPADENYSTVVSPNPIRVYFVGLLAGFGIPFLLIFLNFLFNKKLKDEDIRKMTDIPVVGNIPHSIEKTNNVVFDQPNSAIAEAYRLLRSRMQFFTKDAKAPVILVTSSMPGEGKTFTSINLASAYSLLGKKTILVGFDLRKPKIYQDFKLNNDKGVSTWLIGIDKLHDVIQETAFENLSLISAGPVPPNPSELISLDKSRELLKLLKEKYDYIVVDSSPIGLVSDTFHLASLADAILLVVRPEKTLKDMFGITLREINMSNTRGLSLVINDIQSDSRHYVYGEKYGYTSDNERPKRFMFLRKKVKKTIPNS
jgi:tyrosine-protein kinase Etk/Wzc